MRVEVSDWMDAPVDAGGAREFAVGDVHGHSEPFAAILEAMGRESAGAGNLTLLGDLIDRGPDTPGALALAARAPEQMGFASRTALLGNHETFMRMFLAGGVEARRARGLWLRNGGLSVFEQYGVDPADPAAPERLRQAMGGAVSALVDGIVGWREAGNLLFVHAGVDPDVPLAEQLAAPMHHISDEWHYTWIRFPFLGHEEPFEGGRVVVHGHTADRATLRWKGRPDAEPHRLDGWRLGLDAGSYQTGLVAGAEFRDGGYRVYVAG